jgi:hypothetical protein
MKKILLFIFPIILISCSTPERPKDEDTKLLWGQEGKSIEDIFGNISKDDHYHTPNKSDGFWPGSNKANNNGRFPSSNKNDCGNNKWSNYRNVTSLSGVNHNGLTNQINTYEVRAKHETLMLVAYKIYGDYSLWRHIADLNQDVLGGGVDISPGMYLKYWVPVEGYSFIPEGNPFLVRKGHSLSLISDLVYRDWRRWKDIFAHNQPFIKNANLIHEGSTLFYVPDGHVASRHRVKLPARSGRYSRKNRANQNRDVASVRSKANQTNSNSSSRTGYKSSSSYGSSAGNKKNSQRQRGLSSSQVVKEEIIPVRKAQYSKKSLMTISKIKKAIENTHGNTEINGASKFDRYVEKNFID